MRLSLGSFGKNASSKTTEFIPLQLFRSVVWYGPRLNLALSGTLEASSPLYHRPGILGIIFVSGIYRRVTLIAIGGWLHSDGPVWKKLLSTIVIQCLYKNSHHNIPFLANSIFLAASPCFHPPLLTHIALPSPNSTLSSTAGNWHGQ